MYIGRQTDVFKRSKWANPFPISDTNSRAKVVEKFEHYIRNNRELLKDIHYLKGKNLGCWCFPKRCHGEILQKLIHETISIDMDSTTLDEQVTGALQAMNDILENIQNELSDIHLPIPADDVATPSLDLSSAQVPIHVNDVATPSINVSTVQSPNPDDNVSIPPPLEVSTVETNKVYESILNSSSCSSRKETSQNTTLSDSSSINFSSKSTSPCTNKERFEIDCRLRSWRLEQHSKSLQFSQLHQPITSRKVYSVPTSPERNPQKRIIFNSHSSGDVTIANSHETTDPLLNPVTSVNDVQEYQDSDDGTQKILVFLAEKVDLLALTVNTIQHNLSQISASFQPTLEEKVQKTYGKLDQAIEDKFRYLENKFDHYNSVTDKKFQALTTENTQLQETLDKYISEETEREERIKDHYNSMMDKKFQALTTENTQLQEKLDKYISEETEREERIKECLNNSVHVANPCITDLSALREDLENQIFDLDVRLVECEQYSRRESLVISGIPDAVDQKQLQQKVLQILSTIGLDLVPDDISACHRLYNPPDSQFPAKVVVRFINRKVVNFCLEHRDELQQQASRQMRLNLRFFESLCSKNEETLRICKWLNQQNKIHDHYLRNGFVKLVAEENGRPLKVKHPNILRKKFAGIPEGL